VILNQVRECSVFILSGSSDYIDSKICEIANNKEVEQTIFYGEEFNKGEYFNFIFSPSLFYDFKLAIIRNAEKISDIREIVIESIKENNNKKIICFSIQAEKHLNKLREIKNVKIYKEEKKSYNDYINDIIKLFEQINIKIGYNDAKEFYEMLGRDIGLIKSEIEKISLYFYNKTSPTIDEIFNIINISQYNITFKFTDALCFKNRKEALNIYEKLVISNVNLNMLFYFIVRQFRDILIYKLSPELITGQSFVIAKISKAANLWSIADLKKIFENFLTFDYALKRSSVKIEHLLFNLIDLI
jgi:DNA polymerase-3 subunit delta